MKKSILSLSAAVALGGLGFAGSAGAVVVFDGTASKANTIVQSTANTGHMLYVPYFTAQGGEATFLNIVNTDTTNGKAVKVRFRGASNSDDLLDFTLFLSPGDVWSGMISRNKSGNVQIETNDNSCTIPTKDAWPGEFKADRLPAYVSDSVAQALMGEGYVEILNMADLVPDSTIYKAAKHSNGVPKCSDLPYNYLLSTASESETESRVATKGLTYPTGGLMGSWMILNQNDTTAFSGAATSMTATAHTAPGSYTVLVDTSGMVTGNTTANVIFFPQVEVGVSSVAKWTADPLLVTGAVDPVWFDLPDMSTPLTVLDDGSQIGVTGGGKPGGTDVTGDEAPTGQANLLSAAMGKVNVINEYVATAAGAAVPFATDWVVAQPTRRYQIAVNYGSSAAASAIVQNPKGAFYTGSVVTLQKGNAFGPQACLSLSFGSYDREEGGKASAGSFSPGKTNPFCGEVFVAKFGSQSVLNATVTVTDLSSQVAGQAGWARIGTNNKDLPIPLVGFAATKFSNVAAGVNYGQTLPYRWVGEVK